MSQSGTVILSSRHRHHHRVRVAVDRHSQRQGDHHGDAGASRERDPQPTVGNDHASPNADAHYHTQGRQRQYTDGRTIAWVSSNRAVDTVSQSGIVYPVSPGTDTITASVSQLTGTVSGRATITVTLVPVASVTLTPPSATITLAQTQTLTATLKDANGNTLTGRTITWTSSNHAVDTVSQSGVVYPVSPGTDTITASVSQLTGTVSGRATITVTLVPVATVTLSPPSATITLSQTQALTATLKDANGNTLTGRTIAWASSNHAVDTVSQSGVVYSVSPGTDTITASVSQPGGMISGSSVITVTLVPVASVTLNPPSATITLTQTQALTALLKDANGNTLTGRTIAWVSSNRAVDTVSQSGIVYPVSPGVDTMTASVSQPGGAVSGSAVITVTQVPVASVVVYPAPNNIFATAPGNTVQLQDSTKDASGNNLPGRPVTWTPASGGFATVNSSGLVTATDSAAGTATITGDEHRRAEREARRSLRSGMSSRRASNFFDTSHPDTLSAGATPGYDPSDAGTATLLDTFNTDVSASRLVSWTTSDPTSLLINGQASVANVMASTPVTLTAVSNAGLPTTVSLTVTATDGGTVNVTHSLQITTGHDPLIAMIATMARYDHTVTPESFKAAVISSRQRRIGRRLRPRSPAVRSRCDASDARASGAIAVVAACDQPLLARGPSAACSPGCRMVCRFPALPYSMVPLGAVALIAIQCVKYRRFNSALTLP